MAVPQSTFIDHCIEHVKCVERYCNGYNKNLPYMLTSNTAGANSWSFNHGQNHHQYSYHRGKSVLINVNCFVIIISIPDGYTFYYLFIPLQPTIGVWHQKQSVIGSVVVFMCHVHVIAIDLYYVTPQGAHLMVCNRSWHLQRTLSWCGTLLAL